MSYAKSLGAKEEKLYAKALQNGSAVTYVDENGERQRGLTAALEEMADGYQNIYEEQMAANNAVAAGAAEQIRAETERASGQLEEEYAGVNRGLYRQYRKALASLPQELAAMGYTGGTSETSRVELERGYEENVGESERERIAALTALRDAGDAAIRQGQQAADEANADARREYLEALMTLRERAYDDEWARVEALAAAGDFSGYENYGYSSEDVEKLRVAWESKNPELAIAIAALSGRYSAAEVAAKPAAWVQQYLNALGYALKVDGNWDSGTENAYRAVFGQGSGRYSPPRYYGTKKKEEEKETGGKAGGIRVDGEPVKGGSVRTINIKTSR